MKLPSRLREVLQLLALLDDPSGLPKLLDRIDWTGVMPRHIYLTMLDRLPESRSVAIPSVEYSPRQHLQDAFLSPEFQEQLLSLVLNAFPDKQRLIFVHLPKCAGTDLIALLSAELPWLYEHLSKPEWTNATALITQLRRFVMRASVLPAIFVSGHVPLHWYVDHRLFRNGDRLFSVVRNPTEMAVSQVNYVIKRFFEQPGCREPDTREWADFLGFSEFDTRLSHAELRELAFRIFSHPKIVVANNLCTYLGHDSAASAIDLMARCDIELTDTRHYQQWLLHSWGIESTSTANRSEPIITIADLSPARLAYINEFCREDFLLYERITERMAQRGEWRVFGSELV